MPANISMLGNVAEMAFIGERPWHGLGQELQEGASLETWLKAAGMEWRVQRAKVRYAVAHESGPADFLEWPDRHVLFRSDTKAPLGVVSDGYKVVQPKEVLEFFAHVADENKIQLHTAGVLNGGRQYWALAKTGASFALAGVDRVDSYVMLATSADGSLATTAKFTSVRVVCSNTLGMALREQSKQAIRVKHSARFNAQDVRIDLGLAEEVFAEFQDNAVKLATKRMTRQSALQVLISAIGDEEAFRKAYSEVGMTEAVKSQPNHRQMAEILDLFNGKAMGADSITSAGTAWGLVNAATQYYDHASGRSADSRLQSAWFGVNDQRKQAILTSALAA